MSTVTDALKSKSTRGKFTAILIGAALLILLARYLFFPAQLDSTAHALANFGARAFEATAIALLTGLAIHALAIWVGPDYSSIALIRVLDRKLETDPVFDNAFKTAKSCWYFKGGFGSYFRGTTLPTLLSHNRTGMDVMIVLLDITDEDLVKNYAEYRKQSTGDKSIDASRVRNEIKETIKVFAKAVKENGGAFRYAKVATIKSYSSFRLDLFDDGVVLTQDNSSAPAIQFSGESSYYHGFKQELTQLWTNAIDLKTIAADTLADESKLYAHLKLG